MLSLFQLTGRDGRKNMDIKIYKHISIAMNMTLPFNTLVGYLEIKSL
jgi:hypothetical protein